MAEVIVEGRRLDVMEGLDFSFNYSVADVRDPNKRSTDYTKTIKCPSTKNNDLLFGNIWSVNIANPYDPNSVNIEANFNPNKKADASVIHDGVEVMRGVVQLRSITVEKGAYKYEVVFIGKLKNIFSVLGDKQLNDVDENGNPYVDFSDLDHSFNATNIVNSWSNTSGYVYPMIDWGIRFEYESNGDRIYDIECWRPAVYLKDIVDRIFSFAGFSYTSTFMNSAPFTKLIVPFHSEDFTLTDAQIEARQFIAEASVDQEVLSNTTLEQIGNTNYQVLRLQFADLTDPSNLWNDTSYQFECNALGYYDFTLQSTFVMTEVNPNIVSGVLPAIIRVYKLSNSVESVIDEIQFDIDIPATGSATTTLNWTTQQDLLFIGDTVWAEIQIEDTQYAIINGSNDFTIDHKDGSRFSNRVTEQTIFEGATVYMNNFAPEVEMSDILVSIFKMFNLYVTVEDANPTNLVIETRDEYYAGGTTRDWTYKLARDRKAKIDPLALLTAREFNYTYSEDDDYYNTRYKDNRGNVYGTRTIEVDNDFLKNSTDVEIAFSATPLANDGNTNRIIPKIYDEDIDDGAKPVDTNMRVLYYNGTRPSNPYWTFRYNAESTSDTKTIYPYAGHWDNPITPTLDINFGLSREYYYTGNGYTGTIQVTNNNLFNAYHRKHIEEITNKDSKMLTGYFYLDAWDIQKLDFRDQILIDNTYWRLNKVSDYNPFKEGLTKVELFKVLDIADQPTETFPINTQGETSGGTTEGAAGFQEKRPYTQGISASNFNLFPLGRGSVNGKRNRVSQQANNFKIIGDENFISGGSNRVTIIGSNNQVLDGVSDVVIINSDGFTVTESNTTIIDGKRQWQYVDKTSAYTARDRDYVLADASSAAFTVTLSTEGSTDHWVAVKKTDSSANAVTVAPDSGTIDGSASVDLVSQYDSVDFYSDGTNWHIR